MATPPVKPAISTHTQTQAPARPTQSSPAQGSVDPKEHPSMPSPPHTPSPSGEVIITSAPPLPAERPHSREAEQKPVLESGEAEQQAGKTAMDMWKKRQEAEEEAGKAALKRHESMR